MAGRVYAVKELYYTLQGEGARTGRAAVFCRFAGCNLWTGHEADRADAACYFCDTDFVGTDGPSGGKYESTEALSEAIARTWQGDDAAKYVVFTGGEPLLQLDDALIGACHTHGFEVAIETNGTLSAPDGIDWICVSPKPNGVWVQKSGDELKLVYPMEIKPDGLEHTDFRHFFLQPMDGPDLERNTALAIDYCKKHPRWRLSLQTHKLLGIP
jgi:7-carboxy-7-deazaguanine synthase (Cx14CxxC type)